MLDARWTSFLKEPRERKRKLHFEKLAETLGAKLLLPGDLGFDEERRIWNARLDHMPAAIVRCDNSLDVAETVRFARGQEIPVSVRGGGHSYAGFSGCPDGLIIDLSSMKGVRIDRQNRRALVEAGVRWSSFHESAIAAGLATTGGTVSTVGVAGYTLGGGTGYLARKFGLALDNLVSAEVVTAEGVIVRASETENPDLFWGIRGGAGNFGIVTCFEFKLHPADAEMLAGQIIYPFESAGTVLRRYREVMKSAPDEFVCYPCFIHIPPIPEFPAVLHGRVVIDLVLAYAGATADGEALIRPLQGVTEPILESIGLQSYQAVHQTLDAGVPAGYRWYSRGHYLSELSDEAIATALHFGKRLPGALTLVYFEPMGGAIARVSPRATAFPHRNAAHSFHILAGWMDAGEDETIMAWTRKFHAEMARHSTGGVYVNLLSEDEEERIPFAYGENYPRLVELKRKWDPDNFFRQNANIVP